MRRRHTLLIVVLALSLVACGKSNNAKSQANPTTIIHQHISTTWFPAGAPAGKDDQGISNQSSAWYTNWAHHMCGIDLDGSRELVKPGCDNLFYAALPCADFDETGPIASHQQRSGWTPPKPGESSFKNRWIKVDLKSTAGLRTVYVQWEDVGPLYGDDCDYVFGKNRPRQENTNEVASALDLSPAAFKLLTEGDLDRGIIETDWKFVNESAVPPGPWSENPTTSGPDWA